MNKRNVRGILAIVAGATIIALSEWKLKLHDRAYFEHGALVHDAGGHTALELFGDAAGMGLIFAGAIVFI